MPTGPHGGIIQSPHHNMCNNTTEAISAQDTHTHTDSHTRQARNRVRSCVHVGVGSLLRLLRTTLSLTGSAAPSATRITLMFLSLNFFIHVLSQLCTPTAPRTGVACCAACIAWPVVPARTRWCNTPDRSNARIWPLKSSRGTVGPREAAGAHRRNILLASVPPSSPIRKQRLVDQSHIIIEVTSFFLMRIPRKNRFLQPQKQTRRVSLFR